MASCVRNIRAKSYQNVVIGFQVTVENVGDVFLRHSVVSMQVFIQPKHSKLPVNSINTIYKTDIIVKLFIIRGARLSILLSMNGERVSLPVFA